MAEAKGFSWMLTWRLSIDGHSRPAARPPPPAARTTGRRWSTACRCPVIIADARVRTPICDLSASCSNKSLGGSQHSTRSCCWHSDDTIITHQHFTRFYDPQSTRRQFRSEYQMLTRVSMCSVFMPVLIQSQETETEGVNLIF